MSFKNFPYIILIIKRTHPDLSYFRPYYSDYQKTFLHEKNTFFPAALLDATLVPGNRAGSTMLAGATWL